jgi:hypothetical protein
MHSAHSADKENERAKELFYEALDRFGVDTMRRRSVSCKPARKRASSWDCGVLVISGMTVNPAPAGSVALRIGVHQQDVRAGHAVAPRIACR